MQRYSVDVVADLVAADTAVAVICCTAERDEDLQLPNGVGVISLRFAGEVDAVRVLAMLERCKPTHVCLRMPMTTILRAAYPGRTGFREMRRIHRMYRARRWEYAS